MYWIFQCLYISQQFCILLTENSWLALIEITNLSTEPPAPSRTICNVWLQQQIKDAPLKFNSKWVLCALPKFLNKQCFCPLKHRLLKSLVRKCPRRCSKRNSTTSVLQVACWYYHNGIVLSFSVLFFVRKPSPTPLGDQPLCSQITRHSPPPPQTPLHCYAAGFTWNC